MVVGQPVKWAMIVVAILLASSIAYFPAPYGFETRPVLGSSLIFGAPLYAAFFLSIVLIPILWKNPRLGSILSILLWLLDVMGVVFDQAALAVPGVPPPPIVTAFQFEGVILSIFLIALGSRIYRQSKRLA
jgi:hypothetical protein